MELLDNKRKEGKLKLLNVSAYVIILLMLNVIKYAET